MGIAVFRGRHAVLFAEEPLQVAQGEPHLFGHFGYGGIGLLVEHLGISQHLLVLNKPFGYPYGGVELKNWAT